MFKFKIKVKKSRMWIPALGVVIAYGFFNNCAIAPYFNCKVIDWSQLIMTLAIMLGLGGARDIVLQRFRYLGPVQKAIDVTANGKVLSNKFWIPAIGWILATAITLLCILTLISIRWTGKVCWRLSVFCLRSAVRVIMVFMPQSAKLMKNLKQSLKKVRNLR